MITPEDGRVYVVRDLRRPADDRYDEPARFVQSGGPRGSYWQFFGTDDEMYATEGVEIVARMIVAASGAVPPPVIELREKSAEIRADGPPGPGKGGYYF